MFEDSFENNKLVIFREIDYPLHYRKHDIYDDKNPRR
jgi:hypothetical protein